MTTDAEASDKQVVLLVLEEIGEGSSAEVMVEASKISAKCKDRVPSILLALEKEQKVVKRISKEKKAIVWKFRQ